MTKKISKSEKQETKIESLQDENERLKRAMVLKKYLGVLGFLVVLVATYFGVKNSPRKLRRVTFETTRSTYLPLSGRVCHGFRRIQKAVMLSFWLPTVTPCNPAPIKQSAERRHTVRD